MSGMSWSPPRKRLAWPPNVSSLEVAAGWLGHEVLVRVPSNISEAHTVGSRNKLGTLCKF